MANIYIVERWVDNGYKYEVDTLAIWFDKQVALDYAATYDSLRTGDTVAVRETVEGEQLGQFGAIVYKREYIDHTLVLFEQVDGFRPGKSKEEYLEKVRREKPELFTAEVDTDRLWEMYVSFWEDCDGEYVC